MMLHGAVMYAEAQHLTGICFREDADVSAFLIQISVLPAGKPTFCSATRKVCLHEKSGKLPNQS